MLTNKEKIVVVDGLHFCREDRSGYYHNTKTRKYLHQYIWEKENGKIPTNYHIHHKDHNKNNNNIENLELIEAGEHSKLHWENNTKMREFAKNNIKNAMAGYEKWKTTKEAKDLQHKLGVQNTKYLLKSMAIKTIIVCKNCGKEFEVSQNKKSSTKFCSNNCKSAYRRKQGKDIVKKNCVVCGKEFYANKYKGKQCCSKECSVQKSNESKRSRRERRCV